ncbi:PRC-barrel domain-containing protein [Faunimonas sp. B44]|uniref:PRC-barrel domain-containing protein n=1 Tax=Faunimonas sp. B44 TaxID=3461493 RepID=UPI004043F6F6
MTSRLLAGTAIACLLATGALAAEPAHSDSSFQMAQATTPPAGSDTGGAATMPPAGGADTSAPSGDAATTPPAGGADTSATGGASTAGGATDTTTTDTTTGGATDTTTTTGGMGGATDTTTTDAAGGASDPATTTTGAAGGAADTTTTTGGMGGATDTTTTTTTTTDSPATGTDMATSTGGTTPIDSAWVTEQAENQWRASDYMGKDVYNREDEDIGEVTDLILDEEGGISAIVVGVGGFLGIGQKNVAIAYDAVEIQRDEQQEAKLVVDGNKDMLENAPEFIDKEQQRREADAATGGAGMTGGGMTGGGMGSPNPAAPAGANPQ